MKIQNHIRLVLVMLVMVLLLPTTVSAALPPSSEIQWDNTAVVTCEVIITGNSATASASITGKAGSTVRAWATLYEIIDGSGSIIYYEQTPENNQLPIASFLYSFTPVSGATYYLVMGGVVSKNGVDESIYRTDMEDAP